MDPNKANDEIWDRFADVGRFVLIAGAITAPLTRKDFRGSFNALTAILTTAAVTKTVKAFWSEPRPDGEDNHSFPSQHAAECLAAATSLDRDFREGIGPAAIGLATAVGMARILSGKHHPADVIAGAGLGITAANLATALR